MSKIIGAGIVIIVVLYFLFFAKSPIDILTEPTMQEENDLSGIEVVETTDVHSVAEYGMFTIVEFYKESCSACRQLDSYYDTFLPLRPDVAVRIIELPGDWKIAEESAKYNLDIRSTPHILIFDKKGKLLVQDDGRNRKASKILSEWMRITAYGKS